MLGLLRSALLGARLAFREARRAPSTFLPVWLAGGVWIVAGAVAVQTLAIAGWGELPFRDADRIVVIDVGHDTLDDLRATSSFAAVSEYRISRVELDVRGRRAAPVAALVDSDFLSVLPVVDARSSRPVRPIPGAGPVALVASSLAARLGLDPGDEPARLSIGGVPVERVHLIDAATLYPPGLELWIAGLDRPTGDRSFLPPGLPLGGLLARLAPGVTPSEAKARVEAVAARWHAKGGTEPGIVGVRTLVEFLRRRTGPATGVLKAWLAVLLGCVALIVLGSTLRDSKESETASAIHASLGAGALKLHGIQVGRLAVACLPSLVVAVGPAFAFTALSGRLLPPELAPLVTRETAAVALGRVVTLFVATAGAVTLTAAWIAQRRDRALVLAPDRHRAAGRIGLRRRSLFASSALLFALTGSLVWLGAVLHLTLGRLLDRPLGFEVGHTTRTVVRILPDRSGGLDLVGDLIATTRGTLPGARVALSDQSPFGRAGSSSLWVRDEQTGRGGLAAVEHIRGDFLDVLGLPLLAGSVEGFDRAEPVGYGPCVVNTALASRLLPEGAALGRTLSIGPDACRVVAVVGSTFESPLAREARPRIYRPLSSHLGSAPSALALLVRGARGLGDEALERLAARMPPAVVLDRTEPLAQLVLEPLSQRFVLAHLVGLSSISTLLLATLSAYALQTWAASARAREFAIRVALGDTARGIGRRLGQEALRWGAAALVLGAVFATPLGLAASRLVEGIEVVALSAAFVALGVFLLALSLSTGAAVVGALRRLEGTTLRDQGL